MAGIGFELLKLWKKGTYESLLRVYGITTLIGSGPGLFVIISIGIICYLMTYATSSNLITHQLLSIAAYLFTTSMILSSLLQYTFCRFLADKLYLKEFDRITPNYMGLLLIQLVISLLFSVPTVFYFFSHYSLALRLSLIASFSILCLIWISTVLLTGIKSYLKVLRAFAYAYSVMTIAYLLFDKNDITYLIFEFLLAQVILFVVLYYSIVETFPSSFLIQFNFLSKEGFYFSLAGSNFLYTLGVWIDKFLFWFNKDTSYVVFEPLRVAPIYDLPMCIAYFGIIPATAVFLLQIEANFAIICPKFMETIFKQKTFGEIVAVKNELIVAGQTAVLALIKTQIIATIVLFLTALTIFTALQLITSYISLLFILIIGVGLNAVLWGLLCILYYLAQGTQAFIVNLVFFTSNFLFTLLSQYAGPSYYGYGFGFSLLLSIFCALIFLNKDFNELEYTTFMMTD